MSDLLKSAFGYFNSSSSPGAENDFVGQTVEIGNVKFVVKRVIAEGRRSVISLFVGKYYLYSCACHQFRL